MPTKLTDDVRRVIELVEATGITGRRGVLVLVFSRSGRGVAGCLNANPYNAARAMVEFPLQKYPNTKRPAWLRRALRKDATGRQGPR